MFLARGGLYSRLEISKAHLSYVGTLSIDADYFFIQMSFSAPLWSISTLYFHCILFSSLLSVPPPTETPKDNTNPVMFELNFLIHDNHAGSKLGKAGFPLPHPGQHTLSLHIQDRLYTLAECTVVATLASRHHCSVSGSHASIHQYRHKPLQVNFLWVSGRDCSKLQLWICKRQRVLESNPGLYLLWNHHVLPCRRNLFSWVVT